MSNFRSSQVLAGSFWPVSDQEGVNGDYFMVLSTDGRTPIIFGPKTNNTWVGVPQTSISVTPITYLQYLGDNSGTGQVVLPTDGTGVEGQICFLLDVNQSCCAVAINQESAPPRGLGWNILFQSFTQPTTIYNSGGQPIFIAPILEAPPGPGPQGD